MPRTTATKVILEILRVGDGEWSGKVKLHKAFYFAHLYYANEHPGFLTDWPIAKLEHGPGIHEDGPLISRMVDEGLLRVELVHEGPYPENRYRLTDKGWQEGSDVPNDAHLAIEKAVLFCKDRTASDLSFLSHQRSRSWNEGQMGDILNIYIDIIPDDEYGRRQEQMRRSSRNLTDIFGESPDEKRG
jgi:hypothetical protein